MVIDGVLVEVKGLADRSCRKIKVKSSKKVFKTEMDKASILL